MSGFWRSIIHFEKSKILTWIAFRNSVAVAIPLGVGVAIGQPAGGLICAIGALNVAYSDGSDPYLHRARRMIAASLLVAVAVFSGGLAAGHLHFSLIFASACAFGAGMMVAVGPTAADIGNITLVTLIVFSAHSMALREAWQSGAVALAGGLLQTAFAVALWPVRGLTPERRALGAFYAELARAASAPPAPTEAPPASRESTVAQNELALLGDNPSIEAERYLALLSQAERIRLSLLALSRLRIRMDRAGGGAQLPLLQRAVELASELLVSIAQALDAGEPGDARMRSRTEIAEAAQSLRAAAADAADPNLEALLRDASWQVEALAGQLRAALELAAHVSRGGAVAFARQEWAQPWRLRLTGALAVVRANLNLRSTAFRHALRLAVCVAVGTTVGHMVGWQRSYWVAMTIAIVLRPDFRTTFSRGVLRLAGTLLGLALATALYHLLQPPLAVQVALIFLFTFLMRSFGPANYGIFVTLLSAMIVLLIALTGVAPGPVIAARALNTIAGGAIALLAYAVWPTWERTLIPEAMARMLEAYRRYFEAVSCAYLAAEAAGSAELDTARLAARLARSNLEASSARLRGEPGISAGRLAVLDRMLANSHRFVHAVMALEAGLAASRAAPARREFRAFAQDVERTLDSLVGWLRGKPAPELPDLRERHGALLRSGDPKVDRYQLVNTETDRITNSLNTLAAEIEAWRNSGISGHSS